MKKALIEILENSEEKRTGLFDAILILSGNKYNGFWGENGYNNLIIIGEIWQNEDSPRYYIIVKNCECDVFQVWESGGYFNMDIPSNLGIPRFWFTGYKIKINYDGLSQCSAELIRRK